MSIHADRRHPVAQACDRFAETVDDLGAPALWSASDADIGEIVAAAEQVARRVAAAQAAAVAEGVRRGLPSQVGAAGSTGWLSGLLTVKPQHANRVCRLAAGLAAVPATAAKRS
ncbi:MAG: hypothetical protein M3529_01540 [Actinomycetota bacterium]|nr:hypothetical protein [Actinomycetota bacterium]